MAEEYGAVEALGMIETKGFIEKTPDPLDRRAPPGEPLR